MYERKVKNNLEPHTQKHHIKNNTRAAGECGMKVLRKAY
jgi:hypothetical protein